MRLKDRLEQDEPLRMHGSRFPFAGLLVVVACLATVFYGVVGEDKFLLLSPLTLLGYTFLTAWVLRSASLKKAPASAPPSFFLWVAFVIYGAALSTVALIPFEAKVRMLFTGLFVGAYYLWANSLVLFRRSRAMLGWLMLFALMTSFYGLVNLYKQPDMVLWAERYVTQYREISRLASTYICPNHFAHLLLMLLPFCFVLLFIPKAGLLLRIFSAYCIVVYVPTIILTQSRAGMLGSIAALGVASCLMALRRSRRLFLLIIIVVPLLSSLLLVGAWNYSEMFKSRMTPVVDFLVEAKEDGFANTRTTDFRPLTWLDSIDMVKAEPLTGFGPGSYRYTFPEFRTRFKGQRIISGHPHNEYLEIASEYGLVGFGLFALAWCYGLIRLLVFSLRTRNQHHAFMAIAFLGTAAGTMVHSFFDFQMHVFQNALVFSLLAAIAAGPLCGRRQEAIMQQEARPLRPLRWALALAVLAGLLFSVQTFSSAFLRSTADRLAEVEKTEQAVRYYERAIAIDRQNWRAYKGLGILHYNERYYTLDLEEKYRIAAIEREVFEAAYRTNPKDAGLVVGFGRATIFTGAVDEGIALLREATKLRPFNDNYWWMLGVAQRKAGYYEEALETFEYALTLKRTPSIRKNIEWLERQLGDSGPGGGDEALKADQGMETPMEKQKETSFSELMEMMESF